MAPISIDDNALSLRKKIGITIRTLREKKGISQEQFSEITGHHRTYIGFLERGERTPNIATLGKVAHAFQMKISDLLKVAGL